MYYHPSHPEALKLSERKLDVIGEIEKFCKAADVVGPNVGQARQVALYIGLQLEELAEKLSVLDFFSTDRPLGGTCIIFLVDAVDEFSKDFKSGVYDELIKRCLDRKEIREQLLDADLDLAWVSIGASLAMGADVRRGFEKVNDSNQAKIDPATGKVLKEENGKVIKPEGWTPPDLGDCV